MWDFEDRDESVDSSENHRNELNFEERAANWVISYLFWTDHSFVSVMEYGSSGEKETPEDEISTNKGDNREQLVLRIDLICGVLLKDLSVTLDGVLWPIGHSFVSLW